MHAQERNTVHQQFNRLQRIARAWPMSQHVRACLLQQVGMQITPSGTFQRRYLSKALEREILYTACTLQTRSSQRVLIDAEAVVHSAAQH